MPIPVRVTTTDGTTELTVQNSLASENYQVPVTGVVLSVQLDPDRWILRRVKGEITSPTFHRGILLVNGVYWETYGTEITTAYEDSAFWGDNDISFWDVFPEPGSGYPANLPEPLGHGAVPPTILGQFSTVIWVGNDFVGDLPKWFDTSIQSFLEAGGNVLLMTRCSQYFFDAELTDYLGVTWDGRSNVTLGNCVATYPGLVNIPLTGSQNWNHVFLTAVDPQSTLLFQVTSGVGGTFGTGVHVQPEGGGSQCPDGGSFVLLSGRPYRMDHDALRTNVEFILENLFGGPCEVLDTPQPVVSGRLQLLPSYPNPFGTETVIPFTLPQTGPVSLAVFDAAGRLVRTLVTGERSAGRHQVIWNGGDGTGRTLASGTYFLRLEAAGATSVRSVVLAR
jgi:hypothetical protein